MDLLALSRELIAADTTSTRGTRPAVEILRPLYESAGLNVRVQELPDTGGAQQNLLGTYPGEDPRGLVLVTHLDTVDSGPPEWWTETGGNPWEMTQKGDRLYGLGTADTKLDALCKLFAARQYAGQKLRRSLQLLATCEEEVGAVGARYFVRSDEFVARFAACSEPSELAIIRAHKGYAVVEVELSLEGAPQLEGPFEWVTFDGRSAHSSTPHLGINAVEKALNEMRSAPLVSLEGGTAANKVPARCRVLRPVLSEAEAPLDSARGERPPLDFARGERGPPPDDPRDASASASLAKEIFALWKSVASSLKPEVNPSFDPDRCVVNWGIARIHGPHASLTFDCRLLPGHDPDQFLTTFSQSAQRLAHSHGSEVSIHASRANSAMELKEPSELLASARAACRDVGLDDLPQTKPTNTEAGVFAAAGAEALVFGPGRSTGNAHCANEHNLHSQLSKAIDFYRALIRRLCL